MSSESLLGNSKTVTNAGGKVYWQCGSCDLIFGESGILAHYNSCRKRTSSKSTSTSSVVGSEKKVGKGNLLHKDFLQLPLKIVIQYSVFEDLLNMESVSKDWKKVCEDQTVWKERCETLLKERITKEYSGTCRNYKTLLVNSLRSDRRKISELLLKPIEGKSKILVRDLDYQRRKIDYCSENNSFSIKHDKFLFRIAGDIFVQYHKNFYNTEKKSTLIYEKYGDLESILFFEWECLNLSQVFWKTTKHLFIPLFSYILEHRDCRSSFIGIACSDLEGLTYVTDLSVGVKGNRPKKGDKAEFNKTILEVLLSDSRFYDLILLERVNPYLDLNIKQVVTEVLPLHRETILKSLLDKELFVQRLFSSERCFQDIWKLFAESSDLRDNLMNQLFDNSIYRSVFEKNLFESVWSIQFFRDVFKCDKRVFAFVVSSSEKLEDLLCVERPEIFNLFKFRVLFLLELFPDFIQEIKKCIFGMERIKAMIHKDKMYLEDLKDCFMEKMT